MTDTSYYPPGAYPPGAYPPGAYPPAASPQRAGVGAGGPDASAPVQVAVAMAAAQNRATVAFRVILAIPHLFVLYVLGIAGSIVAVIGWLGALVTGRLPGFAASYLTGYTRWYCRVVAYLLLLTGSYPPFSFEDDAAYPVQMKVSPGRLNRLTVLIRLILAIPAGVVSAILATGVTSIVIVIAWLVALAAGKLPVSLHQAFAAVLRYTIRYYGYAYLLTGAYPAGLFGDKPGTPPGTEIPPAGPGFGAPYQGYPAPDRQGYPAPGQRGYPAPDPRYGAPYPGYGAPDPGYSAPGYGAPDRGYGIPGYGPPGYDPRGYGPPVRTSGRPASWELVLSSGAKRLVGLFIALGLLTFAAEGTAVGAVIVSVRQHDIAVNQLNAAVARHNNAVAQEQETADQVSDALSQLTAANVTLNSKVNTAVHDSDASCLTVSCFDSSDATVAGYNATFGRSLRAISFPAGVSAAAKRLITATAANKKAWTNMSQAVSLEDGVNRATRAEKFGKRFDNALTALVKALNQEGATLNRDAAVLNQEAAALDRRGAELNTPVSVQNSHMPSHPMAT
jgi:uncharacterized protein DUF4389